MTASKTPAAPDVTLRQSARWLPADMDTPISLFLGMCHEHHGILLESAEVDGRWGRYSILACDFLLQAACRDGLLALDTNDDRLRPFAALNGMPFTEGLRTLMRGLHLEKPEGITLPPITRALYGYFGYGMASFFNKKLENCLPQKDADASLVLPGTVLVFDHLYNRLCQISLGEHRDVNGARTRECGAALPFIGEDAVTATPGREGYMDAVNKIKQMLRQGEAIQVVPSCRFSTPFAGDAFTLYRRMRRCNASPYMFFMDLPGITLFGSSPEVMVRCDEGKLQLSPIAGTRKRGADDLEDARLAAELQEDPKERAEHVMLVDLGRNDLGRIARPGTVSGAPKVRAMEIIAETEQLPRGPYAGCIGWLGLDDGNVSLDTGITIRSMWVKDGKLHWQAGGGIVFDSDPVAEWNEVYNKSAIMRTVLNTTGEDHVPAHR